MTVYAKTNHMLAKMFMRFSMDIAKVPPDGPSLQICLLPAQDIVTFICAILKILLKHSQN